MRIQIFGLVFANTNMNICHTLFDCDTTDASNDIDGTDCNKVTDGISSFRLTFCLTPFLWWRGNQVLRQSNNLDI